MEPEAMMAIQRAGLGDWIRMLGSSSPGARVIDREGVVAAVVPACPERSISNSVVFSSPDSFAALHDELDAAYREAGVEAWTAWVAESDTESIALLEARGHTFDGKPLAMTLDLSGWTGPDSGDLDAREGADPADFGRLNDLAYGIPPDAGMARALVSPPAWFRLYAARVDGEPVCVVGTIDHAGGDLGVYFVATHPEHRGRGLASRLMTVAIEAGRERGMRTSSLQASAMGEPVYRRLGYEGELRLNMYERRRARA